MKFQLHKPLSKQLGHAFLSGISPGCLTYTCTYRQGTGKHLLLLIKLSRQGTVGYLCWHGSSYLGYYFMAQFFCFFFTPVLVTMVT